MTADTIVFAGLAILAAGLVALAVWHAVRRSPLIYFGTDALYWMALVQVFVPVARSVLTS